MANSHTLSLSFALFNATVINFLSLLKTDLFFIKNQWAIRIINGPKESLIIDNRHHYYSWGVRTIDKYKGLMLTPLILNKKPRSPVWNLPIDYQESTLAKGNRDSTQFPLPCSNKYKIFDICRNGCEFELFSLTVQTK